MVITGDCPHSCATCPVLNRDLVAHQQLLQHPFELPKAAWYQKTLPTFADALVRQQLWQMQTFQMSSADVDTVKVPVPFSTLGLTYFAMLPNG